MAAVAPLKLQTAAAALRSHAPLSPSPLSASSSSSDSIASMASTPASPPSRSQSPPSQRPALPQRTVSFPTSRPLRPFASIANSTFTAKRAHPRAPSDGPAAAAAAEQPRKPAAVKLIQASKEPIFFTLNLTQADFARRDY